VTQAADSNLLDRPFSVPFVHRLRFTQDVFGTDQHVLADVLERSGASVPRVQFWVDSHVDVTNPDLREKIAAFCAAAAGRLQCTGEVEVVPGGEAIKNDVHVLEQMLRKFHAADLDRRSYVVVIGGGAVLDAVGFAAAIAHRGLRLVRVATSTLAQGDSGIGVKNGVNLFSKKNWLGSFAVPWAVINDAKLLETLSDRDFNSGFSEAMKVSLLKDPTLFEEITAVASRIRQRDATVALPVIRRSALLHLDHITQGGDPFEMETARPLDFGHWAAHKLESMSGFTLRHGEAVAIGVAIDTIYSALACGLSYREAERVLHALTDLGFPLTTAYLHDTTALFAGLEEFRQHLGGELTLTMLQGVGEPLDVHRVDAACMRDAICRVTEFAVRRAESEWRVS
jgi:3-dehydroquinate synthase